jgi:hypothetical protein
MREEQEKKDTVRRQPSMQSSLVIAIAILLVRFLALEATFQRAKSGSELRFPPAAGIRIIARLGGPFLLFVSYEMIQPPLKSLDWLAALVTGGLAVYALVAEPGEILVSSDGLRQRSLFGLRTRTLHWRDAGVLYGPSATEVVVSGSDGTIITHTQYHVDRNAFLFQMQKHDIYHPQ